MKSLGCCTKYAIRRNFPPDANDAEQTDDDDEAKRRRRSGGSGGRNTAGGHVLPTSQEGRGWCKYSIEKCWNKPSRHLGPCCPWRTDQGGQLICPCPGWQVNTTQLCEGVCVCGGSTWVTLHVSESSESHCDWDWDWDNCVWVICHYVTNKELSWHTKVTVQCDTSFLSVLCVAYFKERIGNQ